MRSTVLIRGCALALSLVHLAMVVSLFIPFPSPPLDLPPRSIWQIFFVLRENPSAPVIIAGVLFVPLLLPPLAAFAACRSWVRRGSLLPLWSCLPLLLVGLLFWLLDSTNLVLRLGFAFSFLLTLVETISLPLLLGSQEQVPRLVSLLETLSFAQDKPNISPDTDSGERRSEHTGTRRVLLRLVLPLILVLLCYLLIFLSLFFPYLDTWSDYDPVPHHAIGWQLSGEWLAFFAFTGILMSFFLLMIPCPIAYAPFTPIEKYSRLFRSIALSHLFNLLGFLSSSFLLMFSFLSVGDLHGPFHPVDAAFGIPPAAFLLASIGSGLLLSRVTQGEALAQVNALLSVVAGRRGGSSAGSDKEP